MMNIDPNLALMMLITLVSLSVAVNARGKNRVILSYIIAALCFGIAGMFIGETVVAKMEVQKAEKESLILAAQERDSLKKAQEKLLAQQQAEEAAEREAEAQADSEEMVAYKEAARAALGKAKRLLGQMSRHKLRADTDEEYEELRQKAVYFYGKAGAYKRAYKKIKAAEEMQSIHKRGISGFDLMISSAAKLKRYYNAENSAEEEAMEESFKVKRGQAVRSINKALSALE